MTYSICSQFQVAPDLESVLLMVILGTVFELTTSPVLFAAIGRQALKFWRSQALMFVGCIPGTVLGLYLLMQSTENTEILENTKIVLNAIFYIVAMYRLTMELGLDTEIPEAQELPDKELSRKHCWEFLLVSCGSGFLNGLLGLPGPPLMVYVASVVGAGRINTKTCFILSQSFFLVTTLMRFTSLTSQETQEMCAQHWQLAAVIPVPSLLALWAGWQAGKRFNTKALLRSVLILLLVSSLMGLGLLDATVLGIVASSAALVWLPLLMIRRLLAAPKEPTKFVTEGEDVEPCDVKCDAESPEAKPQGKDVLAEVV